MKGQRSHIFRIRFLDPLRRTVIILQRVGQLEAYEVLVDFGFEKRLKEEMAILLILII